jgi:hypothetical protein
MRNIEFKELRLVSGGSPEDVAKLPKVDVNGAAGYSSGMRSISPGQFTQLQAGVPYLFNLGGGGYTIIQCPEDITVKVEVSGEALLGKLVLSAQASASTTVTIQRECTFTRLPKSGIGQHPDQ